MTQIGAPSPQIQQPVISNSTQQNAQQAVARDSRSQGNSNAQVAQENAKTDYVQLAQNIINSRASGESQQNQSEPQRGTVVNLLV